MLSGQDEYNRHSPGANAERIKSADPVGLFAHAEQPSDLAIMQN